MGHQLNGRRIEVAARSLEFAPEDMTVTEDAPIAIVLTAEDIEHAFVDDELDVHVSADAAQTQIRGFTPVELGEHAFSCTVAGHRDAGMEGTLVVEAAS
jgi:uncharacterized cupredoxin-like copper-binding protein